MFSDPEEDPYWDEGDEEPSDGESLDSEKEVSEDDAPTPEDDKFIDEE